MDTLPAKKRSLLAMGPPDSGKSFFGALVRRQLPRSRVFLPLSTSEFCWNDLDEKMHLVGYANDWRFSPSLPVQPCLNWLEDLEFCYNRKHESPGESRGPPGIFTSNNMNSGWSRENIEAFFARMGGVLNCYTTFQMANMKMKEANKRLEKCFKCGAISLLWKSPILAETIKSNYPTAHKEFVLQLTAFLSRRQRGAGSHSNPPMSEYDALVADAESFYA